MLRAGSNDMFLHRKRCIPARAEYNARQVFVPRNCRNSLAQRLAVGSLLPLAIQLATDLLPQSAYNTAMSQRYGDEVVPLACARCGTPVTPGQGDAYLVRIEALADPTPPSFSEEDLLRDAHREVQRLIEQMSDLSEQELLDQVYRRMIFWLCGPCYRRWIEDPVG